MKTTTLYILLVIAVLLLGACTRNHGDIGPWFGTWHVESITADGSFVTVDGDYFFQFQNKVFRVSQVKQHAKVVESFGTWNEDGNSMTIDFPDPSVFYIEMPGLESHNGFTITNQSSHEVTFTKSDTTGVVFSYHLKKQP